MRPIDADKLYPDCLTKKGLAISQNQIADAPTIDTYTEDNVHYAIKEGHQVGYEMAKAKFERPHGEWLITDSYPHRVYCNKCFKTYAHENWEVWEDGSLPRKFCPSCGADMRKEADNE